MAEATKIKPKDQLFFHALSLMNSHQTDSDLQLENLLRGKAWSYCENTRCVANSEPVLQEVLHSQPCSPSLKRTGSDTESNIATLEKRAKITANEQNGSEAADESCETRTEMSTAPMSKSKLPPNSLLGSGQVASTAKGTLNIDVTKRHTGLSHLDKKLKDINKKRAQRGTLF